LELFQRVEPLLFLLAQALGFLLQRLAEFGEGAFTLTEPIEFAQRPLLGGQLALQHGAQGVHHAFQLGDFASVGVGVRLLRGDG
jgi:hypothetical protein